VPPVHCSRPTLSRASSRGCSGSTAFAQVSNARKEHENTTTVTTPNELEIRVEAGSSTPRASSLFHLDRPKLLPEWWATARSSRRWTSAGGKYLPMPTDVVEGEFREVDALAVRDDVPEPPADDRDRDLGEQRKLTQTMSCEDDRGARTDEQ